MAVSKQPAITPETSSEGLNEEPRSEAKLKRFHPFRVIRKIFRRRVKRQGPCEETEAAKKSWSTSELQSVHVTPDKYEVLSSPPYKIGLSVSHDSIFSPEGSNLISSEELSRPQSSSLSVQHADIKNMFQDELFSRIRSRRDSDDDDIGLPHSPCTSPTTVDVLNQGLKAKSMKSSANCSAGSLISMGSSENDEDSGGASSSGNSSRMSLLDRRSHDFDGECDVLQPVPLNHNAAHHRIAVRPKRTHGLPQKRLNQQLRAASKLSKLPSTPEVIEEIKIFKIETNEQTTTSASAAHHMENRINLRTNSSQCTTESGSSFEGSYDFVQVQNTKHETSLDQVFSETVYSSDSVVQKFHEKGQDLINGVHNSAISRNDLASYLKSDFGPSSCNGLNLTSESVFEKSVSPKLHTSMEHMDNTKVCRTEFTESMLQGSLDSTQESPLQVSALIKNIEQSDSTNKCSKENTSKSTKQVFSAKSEFGNIHNKVTTLKESSISSEEIEHDSKKMSETPTASNNKPYNLGPSLQTVSIEKPRPKPVFGNLPDTNSKKLDTKRESSPTSMEQNQIQVEIKHLFQRQKTAVQKEQTHHTSPALFPEEESIMSEKHVTLQNLENLSNKTDSNISVSHHKSEITEACNLMSMDSPFRVNSINKINFSTSTEFEDDLAMALKDTSANANEALLNSIETKNCSDLIMETLSSNIFRQKLDEDKVTVSVNSTPDRAETVTPDKKETRKSSDFSSPKTVSPSLSSNRKSPKAKATKQEDKKSTPTKEVQQPKPADVPKKVSVEIVPFSQRMKEKKYQPLSYSNNTGQSKHVSGAVIERNLSERRVSPKGKDLDKTNNRHSFSGTLSAEIERPNVNNSNDKPPVSKLSKVQYPVQIRIHKNNKAYEKENSCNDSKVKKDGKVSCASPESSNSLKSHSPETRQKNETQTKWEIKVQTTSQNRNSAGSFNEIETKSTEQSPKSLISNANKTADSKQKSITSNGKEVPERDLSPKPSSEVSSGFKSLDSCRKSLKETKSGDPEPELLRVFARRSIKQKHCDKTKPQEQQDEKNTEAAVSLKTVIPEPIKSKETETHKVVTVSSDIGGSSAPEEPKPHLNLVKKRSQSFTKKEKPELSTPLKEVSVNQKIHSVQISSPDVTVVEPEGFHRRQRTASEPDVIPVLPPGNSVKDQHTSYTVEKSLSFRNEHLHRAASLSISSTSSLSNGMESLDSMKGNPDVLAGHDGNTPSWLQLAQQRREMREQRERLLLGSATNSFLDGSNKPPRSSKVWDMVNNFQKLQMT